MVNISHKFTAVINVIQLVSRNWHLETGNLYLATRMHRDTKPMLPPYLLHTKAIAKSC